MTMTIDEMKKRKRELGYSYTKIEELSGVPFSTIQKIFSGITKSPRYDTLQMLERVFTKPEVNYLDDANRDEEDMICDEPQPYTVRGPGEFTVDDYYNLPEDKRVELIDGYFYDMAAPNLCHQEIAGEIYFQIYKFIKENNIEYKAFIAPVDVQLDSDGKTVVQPDVAILCDNAKNLFRCIYGAPDFALEVISKDTCKKDYTKKLIKYMDVGVREYWILNPYDRHLMAFYFEDENCPDLCKLDRPMPVAIFDGKLSIDFEPINKIIDRYEEMKSK